MGSTIIRLYYCLLLAMATPMMSHCQEWPVPGSQNVAFTFNSGNPNIISYPDGQHNAIDIVTSGFTPVSILSTADIWEITNVLVPNQSHQAAGDKNVAVLLENQNSGAALLLKHLVEDPNGLSLYTGPIGSFKNFFGALSRKSLYIQSSYTLS